MKTDYLTSGFTLPPYLAYPRFLLRVNVRLIAKVVYAILLDMAYSGINTQTDRHGRLYLAFNNKVIAEIINRTPATVAHTNLSLKIDILILCVLPMSLRAGKRKSKKEMYCFYGILVSVPSGVGGRRPD